MPSPRAARFSRVRLYDHIGHGYSRTREADPRIAARIDRAFGDARSVVNVGAGAGNYEPRGRAVSAAEPSQSMIDQRPVDAAPCVRAPAEDLPFADKSFDAALASMTFHHWDDLPQGIAELRRVTRDRIVVFTWDPAVAARSWLTTDYLPELLEIDLFHFESPTELGAMLGGSSVSIEEVPVPADCTDGFIEAFWARPEAYLDPDVRAGCSGFRVMDQAVVEAAMERLAADLASGAWDERHGPLRSLSERDLGYRLIVVEV